MQLQVKIDSLLQRFQAWAEIRHELEVPEPPFEARGPSEPGFHLHLMVHVQTGSVGIVLVRIALVRIVLVWMGLVRMGLMQVRLVNKRI